MNQIKKYSGLIVCLLVLAIVVPILATIFKVSSRNLLTWGIFLLCPLMHIWMMRGMHHEKDGNDKH
jgi:hypothetical protein